MIPDLMARLTFVHRAWRYRAKLDSLEIRWMRGVLRPGDLAVDVGAHKGGYTYWMRRCVGPHGRVFAFEPQRDLAEYLERTVSIFGWNNVVIEAIGLSSSRGSLPLTIPGNGPSPSATLVPGSHGADARIAEVPVETLDDYLDRASVSRSVRLIKCDVEGLELEVFRGAEQTLEEHRPALLFESEARHNPDRSVQEVFGYLEGRGYAGSFFWQGRRCPVRDFDPSAQQAFGKLPYVNNFLFEPP
jgi:FkbM family methyltransferase